MLPKLPFILLALILVVFFLEPWVPLPVQSFLYALSLSIKSVIISLLPVIIFTLLFKTAAQLARQATKMIMIILVAVCCSNFLSTMISYQVGTLVYKLDLALILPQGIEGLVPLWAFPSLTWVANNHAMFAGLLLGILLSFCKPTWAERMGFHLEKVVNYMLKAIIWMMPVFIAGFVMKLSHDRVMESILKDYAVIFAIVALAQLSYVALLYMVAHQFQWRAFVQAIKNMLPAAMTGFGAMSSAAVMPLTIMGIEKNVKDPLLAKAVVPATVNIHLIGDCLAIPIFAFAILKNFAVVEPTFATYLIFAIYFVIAKFSVAAIPGGGILVMLPVLEKYLGFDAAMMSLITALYILFDPVITCTNVLGNGGFALFINKLQTKIFKKRAVPEPLGKLETS